MNYVLDRQAVLSKYKKVLIVVLVHFALSQKFWPARFSASTLISLISS